MLNNIILGGGGSQLRGLDRMIEDAFRDYGGAKVSGSATLCMPARSVP